MEMRGKRKRKPESDAVGEDTASAVLLAALSSQNPDSHLPLLTKSLNKLRRHSFHNPLLLSLLPTLLTRTSASLASRAADMVGSAALESLEMNRTIACDADVIHALLSALSNNPSSSRCSVSACNALLDLCTTVIGRRRLIELSALPSILWEGFVHVAFFSWYQTQKHVDNSFESSIHVISANLFHVAIGLIGSSDPTFRKACLIASIFPWSHTHNWLDLGHRMIFRKLIDKIGTENRFLEVFRSIELAVQENKDPLKRVEWLDFLNMDKESRPNHDQNMPFMEMRNLLSLCVEHRDYVEAAFHQLKSRFCEDVIFEDAIVSYKLLLDKYRKVRKQYMNGMVSLHHQL